MAWRRLDEDGSRLAPHFPALVEDLFCALFKYNVVVLPAEQVAPSAALNRTVLTGVVTGPAYEALRTHTLLDEVRAGLAAVLVGEAILRALREDRVLTDGDLLDLWSLAREEERTTSAEQEAAVGDELEAEEKARAARGKTGSSRGGRPTRNAAALRDAARAARLAARGAAAEREQKRRHVAGALDRVAKKLDRSILAASAGAATKVADLPEALASFGRGIGAAGPRDAGNAIDLGRRLADNPKLRRLTQLFGRMRDQALAMRRRILDRADEELYEIGLGRGLEDLARLIPHELTSLSHPLLRRDFRRRLLDGELLTYALRGTDRHGRGPLVVCLDTSSSMAGDKELWAKAVTLTFVELARRRRRRCHVICFSSGENGLRDFDMNPRTPYEVALDRTLDLAEHFPGGGTDFMAPLDAALRRLQSRDMRRGDVVLITDGECEVTPEWKRDFLLAKRKRDFSLYGILIDIRSAESRTVRELADRVSLISDLTADHTRELFADRPRPRRRAA
jgi:uncharacterized protein with von Willebrand factor type A (vWA) domain